MIHEIYPHDFKIGYENKREMRDSDVVFLLRDGMLLLNSEGRFFTAADVKGSQKLEQAEYLFMIDETAYFGIESELEGDYKSLRFFRTYSPLEDAFAASLALQLCGWYWKSRYCGCCGTRNENSATERARICPKCGNIEYPRICPAVIVAITDGDKLLLTKYAGRAYSNYALVAGFTEMGESLEQTVKREVREETGLEVGNIRYYKSQPWCFSGTLLAGFFCEVSGSNEIKLDENELALAQWFSREDIPEPDNDISLTAEMIRFVKNSGKY